jgi:1-acyl-sn-glycerol-3-phosphate acyltransferase
VGCPVDVSGLENIPKQGGLCVVSNHLGIFDIVLHIAYLGRPIGFIAKKELSLVPIINIWIILIGGLFIDRGNRKQSLRCIEKAVQHIEDGGSMLIFPEGTRSRDRGLLPFKPGSFRLATQTSAPILPAAITGSYDVFERNMRVERAPVTLRYGEPIASDQKSGDGRRTELAEQIRAIIAQMLPANSESNKS